MQKELIEYFSTFVTPERLNLFERIIENRTSYFTVVLEDIYQSQNASAVLRTCDCFGIQHVNVIENRNIFDVDKEVALGSSKWLSIRKFTEKQNNSLDAVRTLKKEGFRIVATSPHSNDTLLDNFDVEKGKAAFVFGSELPGISETIMNEADEFVKIPMYGFTESFNISVSAAILLHHLTEKLRKNIGVNWKLTAEEKESIRLQWLRSTVKRSNLLETRFAEKHRKKED